MSFTRSCFCEDFSIYLSGLQHFQFLLYTGFGGALGAPACKRETFLDYTGVTTDGTLPKLYFCVPVISNEIIYLIKVLYKNNSKHLMELHNRR